MQGLRSGQRTLGSGGKEGGRKAYGVAETPRADRQGAKGGVNLSQGINTPVMAELPRGKETPGVATKGKGVLGEDVRGQRGDRKPTATQ